MTALTRKPRRQWRDYRTAAGGRPVKAFIDALADEEVASIVAGMREVVLSLSVFEKRTQKTPPRELELAEGRLRDWRQRGTAKKKAVTKPRRS